MPDPSAARDEVREQELAFAATMAERDHDAFVGFLSEDVVFLSGGTLRGRRAVADAWRPYFEGPEAPFAWEPDLVEVLASGNLAFSSGPIFDSAGRQVSRFNTVWRLEDGAWRVVFDKGDGK